MRDRPRILVIDDESGLRALVLATLGEAYLVVEAADGNAALAAAAREAPDLILLDIKMPGPSGYEVCMKLKAAAATRPVPVIFLSAFSLVDDRLAAYEAGAEDFLPKPFDPDELREKVEVTLRNVAERERLAAAAKSAQATAMTALSAAGELGVVMDFLRRSFACESHETLADAVVEAAASYSLTASVQIRGAAATVTRNARGAASPLEASILATLGATDRVASLGRRVAISYPRVTIMVVDLPVADGERAGRLRDDLAWLAEAAETRVQAMDNELTVRRQGSALERLVARTRAAIEEMERRHASQGAEAIVAMNRMIERMEATFYRLGLSESQELAVSQTLRLAVYEVHELLRRGLDTDAHLRAIATELAGSSQ